MVSSRTVDRDTMWKHIVKNIDRDADGMVPVTRTKHKLPRRRKGMMYSYVISHPPIKWTRHGWDREQELRFRDGFFMKGETRHITFIF